MMRRNANRDGGGRWWLAAATLAVALASAGPVCADPLEPVNRVVFTFNAYAVDYVIDPIARVLKTWVPGPVQIASGNVYENLTEPEFVVAHWLAGDSRAASASLNRLLVNSTLGIGGIFDVASRIGIQRKQIEFTEALCAAGLPSGDYVVLPLVGPTSTITASAVSGFIVGGWFLLNMVSTTLATADLVIDLSASAASLRYVDDMPGKQPKDTYVAQRESYDAFLAKACPSNASRR